MLDDGDPPAEVGMAAGDPEATATQPGAASMGTEGAAANVKPVDEGPPVEARGSVETMFGAALEPTTGGADAVDRGGAVTEPVRAVDPVGVVRGSASGAVKVAGVTTLTAAVTTTGEGELPPAVARHPATAATVVRTPVSKVPRDAPAMDCTIGKDASCPVADPSDDAPPTSELVKVPPTPDVWENNGTGRSVSDTGGLGPVGRTPTLCNDEVGRAKLMRSGTCRLRWILRTAATTKPPDRLC
jgi:hypothetical protein